MKKRNLFFKAAMAVIALLLAIATISEIRNPAVADGFGVQWPVYVIVWPVFLAIAWAGGAFTNGKNGLHPNG